MRHLPQTFTWERVGLGPFPFPPDFPLGSACPTSHGGGIREIMAEVGLCLPPWLLPGCWMVPLLSHALWALSGAHPHAGSSQPCLPDELWWLFFKEEPVFRWSQGTATPSHHTQSRRSELGWKDAQTIGVCGGLQGLYCH